MKKLSEFENVSGAIFIVNNSQDMISLDRVKEMITSGETITHCVHVIRDEQFDNEISRVLEDTYNDYTKELKTGKKMKDYDILHGLNFEEVDIETKEEIDKLNILNGMIVEDSDGDPFHVDVANDSENIDDLRTLGFSDKEIYSATSVDEETIDISMLAFDLKDSDGNKLVNYWTEKRGFFLDDVTELLQAAAKSIEQLAGDKTELSRKIYDFLEEYEPAEE